MLYGRPRGKRRRRTYGNIVKLSSVTSQFKDSFSLAGDNFYILKNQAGKYEVLLNINAEKKSERVYYFYSTSLFDTFSDDLKKIMNSAANGFKEVLGEKKEVDGFRGKSYQYAINASLYGISDLSYIEGGLSFVQDVTGIYYEGTDKTAAKEKYASLTGKIKNTLGSAFDEKYVYRKSESTDGEWMQHIFAKESEIYHENAGLAIAEYSYDKFSKKYLVKIIFRYKGFGDIF